MNHQETAGLKRGVVAAALLLSTALLSAQTWNTNGNNQNWGTAGNWSPASVPNAVGATATLGSIINNNRNINVNGSFTLGTLNVNNTNVYTLNGGTLTFDVNSGSATINIQNSGSPVINSNLYFKDNLRVNPTSSGYVTFAGDVKFEGSKTIEVLDGSAPIDLDITGNVTDQWYTSLTKTGAGTMRLAGNNTFQGPTTISAGTVIAASNNALGASSWNNEIANGAALHLTGGITLNEGSFTAAGTGPDGQGVIRSLSGNNTYNGTITFNGAASTIGINSGTGLTIGGSNAWVNVQQQLTVENSGTFTVASGNNLSVAADLIFNGNGNTTLSAGQISGSGTITKNGSGTMLINGSGTFSPNAMDIREGRLDLDRFFNPGNKSGLTIGTTSGPSAEVRLLANDRLRDDLLITIRESGVLNLNDKNEDVAALTLYGGTVNTGTGTLTLANAGGDVIKAEVSTQVATINGAVQLAQNNLQAVTINVADSALDTELVINGPVSQQNPNIQTLLVKSGTGTLEFTGTQANTYKGITRVDAGTLVLNKTDGVDAIGPNSSIVVNSGGTLLLNAKNQINDTTNMTLSGGVFNTGVGVGHDEKLGTLTLTSNSSIDLGSGVHLLEFANSSALSDAWTGILSIYGWTGDALGGTQGQIYFGNNSMGLTSSQLSQISFDGFGMGAAILANGQIVPIAVIPEAEVIWGTLLLAGGIVWYERNRLRKMVMRLLR